MSLLGAVLAGGRSSRFGSDKGAAVLGGASLLERVRSALAAQCDAVCVMGGAGEDRIPDWPAPGMGPLAGLAGALRHARENGFAEVLTSAVDIPDLPADLARQLGPAPAFVVSQPTVGRWRTADWPLIEGILTTGTRHSLQAFAAACHARPVTLAAALGNINTPEDFARYCALALPPGLV